MIAKKRRIYHHTTIVYYEIKPTTTTTTTLPVGEARTAIMNQDDNKAFLTTLRDINKEINNATDFTDSSVRHGNVFLPPIHHDENDTRNQNHTENLDTGTTATGPAPATTTNHMDQDFLQHTIADAGRWAFGSNCKFWLYVYKSFIRTSVCFVSDLQIIIHLFFILYFS